MKPTPVRHGYLRVSMSHNGNRKDGLVAIMVLEAFVGPRPAGMVCAHNNGVNTDNRASNLRWATYRENEADKALHGTRVRGSAHKLAKLTEANVRWIRRAIARGVTHREIAERFGINKSKVSHIATGLSWKHVK